MFTVEDLQILSANKGMKLKIRRSERTEKLKKLNSDFWVVSSGVEKPIGLRYGINGIEKRVGKNAFFKCHYGSMQCLSVMRFNHAQNK